MANISSMLSIGQRHDICSEDIAINCTNVTVSDANDCNGSKILEDLQCFVCDAKIQGRHYALATCRTQISRTRVIEKLGELVGERYMVVISEDDVICRSCANLINTLDKLDVEMCNVRDNVLRFLEQKYSLEKGELLGNNEKQKRSQPPQITKCNSQTITNYQSRRDVILSSNITEKPKHKKSNVWLQCDKCQYTTLHNSFIVHHIRNHSKQKIFCDKCGVQFYESQQESHNCNMKEHINNQIKVQDKQAESSLKCIDETILDIPILEKNIQQNVPIMTIETYSESQISNRNENIPIIRLSNSENLSIQNILTSDNTSATGQPIYVRILQPVEVNEAPTHSTVMVSHSDTDLAIKLKDNSEKQILTLTEDGNLEMAEIACWNDIQSSESQTNIMFQ
ncbi:PREDICTED: uncharacterized protein LOC108545379 [Eufriesea mexicana]|uniref:uncharacterized protein LOC108545379 n=1 Tax=Eufriesea mexicana TaxID=516756 RepID=UPI00083C682A|nr:PREDICTED: uncharacterized protein LOC108545379 [Eufriesea mexicana]